MALEVRTIPVEGEAYESLLRLREEVLRKPLGVALRVEDTRQDHEATLFGAYEGDTLCGCVILAPAENDSRGVLRQMAVSEAYQGRGLGKLLVTSLEAEAQARGMASIRLHARESAIDFYYKLGYVAVGEMHAHPELGVNHVYMEKLF